VLFSALDSSSAMTNKAIADIRLRPLFGVAPWRVSLTIRRGVYRIVLPHVESGWLGSRVVSVLDSGAVGPGFKSQSRRCRVTVLGKLFTPIVPLFTEQRILLATLLRAATVTTGMAESNCSLSPGL